MTLSDVPYKRSPESLLKDVQKFATLLHKTQIILSSQKDKAKLCLRFSLLLFHLSVPSIFLCFFCPVRVPETQWINWQVQFSRSLCLPYIRHGKLFTQREWERVCSKTSCLCWGVRLRCLFCLPCLSSAPSSVVQLAIIRSGESACTPLIENLALYRIECDVTRVKTAVKLSLFYLLHWSCKSGLCKMAGKDLILYHVKLIALIIS